jgi:hypothetical protein
MSCPAFGLPTSMPYCCCTADRRRCLHTRPNSSGGPCFVEIGKIVGRDGFGGKRRRAGAHRRHRSGTLAPSMTAAGDAVMARPRDVVVDARGAGRLARPDRRMEFVDRRLFETERLPRFALLV